MYEKEAEEWVKENMDCCKTDSSVNQSIPYFGEEERCCAKSAFQAGAEFGYNKANEWHYPSKGELPKCDEETQLIFYVNCYYEIGGETKIRKRTVLGFYKKSFMNDDVKLFVEKSKGYEDEHLPKDVIAWKEIVLPELKESE
ncbi:MAG: hypothetical protein IKF66_01230 [Methanobrevibacter sp.]|nr:hypothetical protein [Methanobrevibacter sp.]